MDYKKKISFGFEQTFTIKEWWTDSGFVSESDTPLKRKKILDLSVELVKILDGSIRESKDIYNHMQYEVYDDQGFIQYWVTLDPGSIEVKTNPLDYNELEKVFEVLFEAAYAAELYPYRQWWYGVKAGTEGGTHINMGGKTLKDNIFYQNPTLLLKYVVFVHNNPCVHYPFMGPDVGPEGNAMRIDEQENNEHTIKALKTIVQKLNKEQSISLKDMHRSLKDTSLMMEKCSMPSLFKFKEPLYLIEDRAQEAFRSADEVLNIIDMKLAIFHFLEKEETLELLVADKELHKSHLSYRYLWDKFQDLAEMLGLSSDKYKIFFERQFPLLTGGGHASDHIEIREGRRPRIITDKKFSNGICISKTVDTRHKRFEFQIVDDSFEISVIMPNGEPIVFNKDNWAYSDILVEDDNPKITVKVTNKKKESQEEIYFDMKNMMWD